MKTLSILICTVEGREDQLRNTVESLVGNRVVHCFETGAISNIQFDEGEIIIYKDNKEISVGAKRQTLLLMATCKWCVFRDDDDKDFGNYIDLITDCINANPYADCIGINGIMTTDGKNEQRWIHSLKYPRPASNKDGWDYVRPIIHFNPVLTSLALKAGFKDMRFGEDMDYGMRLKWYLKNEALITSPLFHYCYSTEIKHKEKYGIK